MISAFGVVHEYGEIEKFAPEASFKVGQKIGQGIRAVQKLPGAADLASGTKKAVGGFKALPKPAKIGIGAGAGVGAALGIHHMGYNSGKQNRF